MTTTEKAERLQKSVNKRLSKERKKRNAKNVRALTIIKDELNDLIEKL